MQPKHVVALVAAIAIASTATLAFSLISYEQVRAEWSVLSAQLGQPDYDADASDAAYARTEIWLPWITYSANATGVAVIVLALVLGALAPERPKTRIDDRRLIAATLVDFVVLLVAAAPAWIVVRADPGLTVLVTRVFPGVAVGWIAAAAASGRTIGARALRISLGTPPSRELGARIVFAQPALLLAPLLATASLARLARGEHPPFRWLAPHLALAGVTPPS